jgi:hypothetical protein
MLCRTARSANFIRYAERRIVPKIPTKFFLYNYIISKKSFIFVATIILKSETARQLIAGIFYVCTINKLRGFSTPVWSVNAPTALKVIVNGKG